GPTVREVRVIEQIERLHSELRLQFFAQNIVVFEEREIEVVLDRSAERIPAQVAQSAGEWEREALDANVVVRFSGVDCAGCATGSSIWIEVRSLSAAVTANLIGSRSRHIVGNADTEWPPALQRV